MTKGECSACHKVKKIILSYRATAEVNGKTTTTDVRLCRECLLKQALKKPLK